MRDCDDTSISSGIHHLQMVSTLGSIMFNINSSCLDNCSGHGDCYNGTCFCEVKYSGGTCTDPNFSYYIAFSSIFYIICGVSFIQLILSIKAEFSRLKSPSLLKACRVTKEKLLYVLICLATGTRGFYFSSPENSDLHWASGMTRAFYPLVLTGSSLIVCFWAEVFHLPDVQLNHPHFLSKSFLGFIAFNIIPYSMLITEVLLHEFFISTENEKSFITTIFDSLYAALIFIVVIFFLIYGVQVYFKVRGGFIEDSSTINFSQLHQSRLGLISQAILLLLTAGFIISDVLGSFWKDKLPVMSRNWYDITYKVAELGVVLWFPCVLWNCIRPEQLWILNPKRILQKLERKKHYDETNALVSPSRNIVLIKNESASLEKLPECWICYDSERTDAGPLIQPCNCKGDVSVVHHECLKRWLVESSSNPDCKECKVCKVKYELESGHVWLTKGLTPTHWVQTAAIITVMCSAITGACICVKMFNNVGIRTLAVGIALILEYVCLRLLGFSILRAYQRAKISAVKILGQKFGRSNHSPYTSTSTAHVRLLNGNNHLEELDVATVQQSIIVVRTITDPSSTSIDSHNIHVEIQPT